MYNKILDPLTDVKVSTEMLLSGALGTLSGDQREEVKRLYTHTSSLYTLFVDVIMAIGLEKIAARPYLSERFSTALDPMQSISRGLLDETDGPLLEEQIVSVQFIAETAQQLRTYVDRLWLYSQLENRMLTPRQQHVSLMSLLRRLQQESRQPSRLEIAGENELITLVGDVNLIRMMFAEVIDNAFRFSTKGKIMISCQYDSSYAVIHVSDTGKGIAPIYQTTITNAFFQIDEITEGLGLGLYFAKQLALLHHGMLELTSRIHHGSQFAFRLPLAE